MSKKKKDQDSEPVMIDAAGMAEECNQSTGYITWPLDIVRKGKIVNCGEIRLRSWTAAGGILRSAVKAATTTADRMKKKKEGGGQVGLEDLGAVRMDQILCANIPKLIMGYTGSFDGTSFDFDSDIKEVRKAFRVVAFPEGARKQKDHPFKDAILEWVNHMEEMPPDQFAFLSSIPLATNEALAEWLGEDEDED